MKHVKSLQKFSSAAILLAGMLVSANTYAVSVGVTTSAPPPSNSTPVQSPTQTPPVISAPAATTTHSTPPATNAPVPAAVNNASVDIAATSIGQVIWAKGTVEAFADDGQMRTLSRRSPIYAHDTIKTEADGTGELAFTDSSLLTLRTDSELKLDEYHYQEGAKDGSSKSVMSLVKGGFRTITGKIPKENPDGYSVNTPVATIGVRGTDYSAFYSQATGLIAKIDTGRIIVRNDSGAVELGHDLTKIYAEVHLNQSPAVVAKAPAVFSTQPAITPAPVPVVPKGPPGGPPKTVSSFCVGLLKGMFKVVSDFFV
jgi:hypothetical protein